ncbi:FMN-linked oxidoreductase [Dendrothele bispora CBS 962.96]|uniref:FMN-linked oxidoreductase n=1 Tax=Dendrothele bispora (strain CBS 962.96) TaxID=1314807 RepID=A0A4S8L377_DENBC|nr:FMN-linked oxidoreductase [Dendrothele bispora CBS 962.96]
MTSSLLNPLKIGPYTTRNRIFMSALTRNRSVPTNVPNELNLEYYRQRARSAGLIVTEGILVAQQGSEWPHAPGIWSREQVEAWKKVTDAVHAEGGLIYAQLWHLGRVAHPEAPEQIASGQPVYAPSAIAARGGKFRHIPGKPNATYVTPTEIDDPKKLVALFKKAAINAKEAGFDGVEYHGANGYLPTQFLDSTANHRTDSYGGSIQNRAKFVLESLSELSEVWGPERVGIKISPGGGYNDVGMPLEETIETFSYLIQEIDKLGIGYITLTRYGEALDPIIDGKRRGTPHDIVATYGPLVKNPKTVVLANSGFTPEEGAQHVSKGSAAAIVYGMLWITHPDLARRIQEGKPLDGQLDMGGLYGHYPPYPHSEDLMKGKQLEQLKEDLKKGYTDYPDAV